MKSGIYKITNLVNHKAYIGSAVDIMARWGRHRFDLKNNKHHSGKLQNSWNKHGKDNFSFEKLIICSEQDLIFYEQKVIDLYETHKNGYNVEAFAGSSLGRSPSAETRAKLSAINKGKKYIRSEEYKRKISLAKTGVKRAPFSQEWLEKLAKSRRGRVVSEETREKIRIKNTGRKHTEESKKKMSESHKGCKLSRETIEKQRLSRIGYRHSAETKEKMSLAKKGHKRTPEHIRNYLISRYGEDYVLNKESK